MNEIMQDVHAMTETIENSTGIKLEWHEIAELKHYYLCYDYNIFVTLQMFYREILGLDPLALSNSYIMTQLPSGRLKDVKPYGSNWLRDERFKQYCRERVQEWRDERCLI